MNAVAVDVVMPKQQKLYTLWMIHLLNFNNKTLMDLARDPFHDIFLHFFINILQILLSPYLYLIHKLSASEYD